MQNNREISQESLQKVNLNDMEKIAGGADTSGNTCRHSNNYLKLSGSCSKEDSIFEYLEYVCTNCGATVYKRYNTITKEYQVISRQEYENRYY